MTAVVPMLEPGAWTVPLLAVYPMGPVPVALHVVGMLAPCEDEGSKMRQAMTEMPVHFSGCHEPQRRILCYGDSLTAGFYAGGQKFDPYGRTMSEVLVSAGLAIEVSVCGHSGRTTREMLEAAERPDLEDVVGCRGAGLQRILAQRRYDLVIIMSGTNDMGRGTCSQAILEDLAQLHAVCHQQGVPTLALAPPAAPRYSLPQEIQRQYISSQLNAFAAANPEVLACLDPSHFVLTAEAQFWELDGLHFAPLGSQALGRHLACCVAQLA